MFHDSLLALGFLVALGGLLLAFLSQRYWFARAWRFSGRIQEVRAREAMRGMLLALVGIALFACLSIVLRTVHGTVSRGSFWIAFLGFWLSSSIVSYLFIQAVAGADWAWRRLRAAFSSHPSIPAAAPGSAGEAARGERIDHSRRRLFHAAGFVAGAVPFLSAGYGFAEERFRYQVREVQLPIANLPRALDGLRITQVS
ncbi:MAG: hypothetical protein ACRD4Y_01395, partial [Candidatus Acidiferrales bacterium]